MTTGVVLDGCDGGGYGLQQRSRPPRPLHPAERRRFRPLARLATRLHDRDGAHRIPWARPLPRRRGDARGGSSRGPIIGGALGHFGGLETVFFAQAVVVGVAALLVATRLPAARARRTPEPPSVPPSASRAWPSPNAAASSSRARSRSPSSSSATGASSSSPSGAGKPSTSTPSRSAWCSALPPPSTWSCSTRWAP